MAKLNPVVHQNYIKNDKVYCRKQNKVIPVSELNNCFDCEYLYGMLQGEGVECAWDDAQEDRVTEVDNPSKELLRVSALIDNKVLSK